MLCTGPVTSKLCETSRGYSLTRPRIYQLAAARTEFSVTTTVRTAGQTGLA
jgi:hypothetical protein